MRKFNVTVAFATYHLPEQPQKREFRELRESPREIPGNIQELFQ